jgi:hypothetical protein
MANGTSDEIEQAATAEYKKYVDRVKDMDDLQSVQLMAQEEILQQLIRIRLELSALRLTLGSSPIQKFSDVWPYHPKLSTSPPRHCRGPRRERLPHG